MFSGRDLCDGGSSYCGWDARGIGNGDNVDFYYHEDVDCDGERE